MRPSRRWGFAAAGWAATFAALHLYWALGGSVGLAESAGGQLAEQRPGWFVAFGLYGVAVVLTGAAALALLLARGPGRGRWRAVPPLLGAGVAAVLVVRALVVHLLLLTDAEYGDGAISAAQRTWALWVWNPWFLLGGVAFAMTALAARSESAR